MNVGELIKGYLGPGPAPLNELVDDLTRYEETEAVESAVVDLVAAGEITVSEAMLVSLV